MEHFTYEILKNFKVDENNNDFINALTEQGITFEKFKISYPEETEVLLVRFRNITVTPSTAKKNTWLSNNRDYTGDPNDPDLIIHWANKNNNPYPDIYDTIIKDQNDKYMSSTDFKKTLAVSSEYHYGGNHKSRRNRKRKNIKKSKKNYKGEHKIKKNRSKRINL